MITLMRPAYILLFLLLAAMFISSQSAFAEAREQKVWIEVSKPEGGECKVSAVFKGDHDNCNNDAARGRADCSRDVGCVCTRQEKHVTWEVKNKQSFTIAFDQGSMNPFVIKGSDECSLKSNKKGKLRCTVKGKDVPRGDYKYSIEVPECPIIQSHIKIY